MKNAIAVLFIFIFTVVLNAQEGKNKVKFSELMFVDYYYYLDNFDAAKKNLNGLQFRRIYFTSDYSISNTFDTRFRLDANQIAASLTSDGRIGVMVKDAYLRWRSVFSCSDPIFGLLPTRVIDIAESEWRYRSLEKTPMDLFGIVSSRNIGIELKGTLFENGSLNYWVKFGNNSANAPEVDKYKRFYANLLFKLAKEFQASFYGGYAVRLDNYDLIAD